MYSTSICSTILRSSFVFLLVVPYFSAGSSSVTMIPSGERVAILGKEYDFLCFASGGDTFLIQWQINTSSWYDTINRPPYGRIEFNNETKFGTLTFDVVSQNQNNTFISCSVLFTSGNRATSSGCDLIVQDLLASVGALTLTNPNKLISYLSWTAPFTLNLQISPPFILYCIDAWNTRGLPMQYAKLVYSVCNMENTSFSFNSSYLELSSCDTLIFTITPVNLAGNGTSASIEGAPLNYTEVQTPQSLMQGDVEVTTVYSTSTLHIKLNIPQLIQLVSIIIINDDEQISYHFNNLSTSKLDNTTVITLSNLSIPFRKKYNSIINITNCVGSTTSHINISTFEIQYIFISECENSLNCWKINISSSESEPNYSGILLMLVPKGKGVLDCLYFLLRYVKPNLDYFIQPIPIGSYDVFLYELSITGLITSLPAIQSAGEIKQGISLPENNYYPNSCTVAVINITILVVSCNVSAARTVIADFNPTNRNVLGFSVLLQNSQRYQYLKTVQVIGSTSVLTINLDEPGQYRVTVFPVQANVYRGGISEQISEPVIHSEITNILGEKSTQTTNTKETTGISTTCVAISTSTCFIVYILGLLSIVLPIAINKKIRLKRKPKLSSTGTHIQEISTIPIYEDVGPEFKTPVKRKAVELQENVAYGFTEL